MNARMLERVAATAYAGAFAVMPIMADHHVISVWLVSAVGVVTTAVIAAWQGSKIITAWPAKAVSVATAEARHAATTPVADVQAAQTVTDKIITGPVG